MNAQPRAASYESINIRRKASRGSWVPSDATVCVPASGGRVQIHMRGGNTIQLTAEQARQLARQLVNAAYVVRGLGDI
jgi:hypothetical protein